MSYERQTFRDFDEENPLCAEHLQHIEDGIVQNEGEFVMRSQGRSAKYNITSGGWKRVLNIIRATNGMIDFGVVTGGGGKMVHALSVDISGFVKYAEDTSAGNKPVILKRYENVFGEDKAIAANQVKITKVRIGYPRVGTEFPVPAPDGELENKLNPVNCYVDIFVELNTEALYNKYASFNMNFSGFADSHNCVSITEETDGTPTGMYGETLDFYEVDVAGMPSYISTANFREMCVAPNYHKDGGNAYGITVDNNGWLRTERATNANIDDEAVRLSGYRPICTNTIKYAVEKFVPKPHYNNIHIEIRGNDEVISDWDYSRLRVGLYSTFPDDLPTFIWVVDGNTKYLISSYSIQGANVEFCFKVNDNLTLRCADEIGWTVERN